MMEMGMIGNISKSLFDWLRDEILECVRRGCCVSILPHSCRHHDKGGVFADAAHQLFWCRENYPSPAQSIIEARSAALAVFREQLSSRPQSMTRLVSVRVVCDSCLSAQARVYCVSVRRALCTLCSQTQAPHSRAVDLARTATAVPLCERCDAAPATAYSPRRDHTLCSSCDAATEQESFDSERGILRGASARASRRRSSQDIVLALKQRSVRFTGPGPPHSSSATPASSPSPYMAHPGAYGLAMQQQLLNARHPSRALAPAYANGSTPLHCHGHTAAAANAAASAAAARILGGGPSGWPSAPLMGAGTAAAEGNGNDGRDPSQVPASDGLRNLSQYFYIAHYQQQRLQQLYLQQLHEEAAAVAAVTTAGNEELLPRVANCSDSVAPAKPVSGIKSEPLVGGRDVQSAQVASANGKRRRSPQNTHAGDDGERASAVRKVNVSGDFSLFDGNGDRNGDRSGEGSGGSGRGSGSDGSADEQRDSSADGSGSSRRSDVAAPQGVPNCAVLTAAAVAAAGEMYLLNSVYPGSSNCSLVLPPPDVDPAGLVTAANVAAAGASAAIAADAAAANAAAIAAVYGSHPKRERVSQTGAWNQKRTGHGDRCSSLPSNSNTWGLSGNGNAGATADIASSLYTQPGSSVGAVASKRSSAPSGSGIPESIVGSSVIGAVAGSLDEGGMPDVSGFDENLDFSFAVDPQ